MDHALTKGIYCYYESPIGRIFIATTDDGISTLNFTDETVVEQTQVTTLHPFLQLVIVELNKYFSGNLKSFSVPLDPHGTDFQKKVWQAILEIPYGNTISYSQLSATMGQPDAIRAIANANARNPVLILMPCHRVIGSSGELTGYAGGLDRKKLLLELEGAIVPSSQLTLF